jgi:hypothetical protein
VAGGGARRPARRSSLKSATVHQRTRGRYQNEEEEKWTPLSSLKGKKRRRRSGSAARRGAPAGFLGGGGVEGEKSSIERCGWRGARGRPFIGGEGSGGAAGEAVDGGHAGGRH